METITVFGSNLGSQLFLRSPNNLLPTIKANHFLLKTSAGKNAKQVSLKATVRSCDDQKSNRTFKKLPPSEWGHLFLSAHVDFSEMDVLGKKIEALKPKVKSMLMYSPGIYATKKRTLLIHLLLSLGLAYHFQDEIEENLKHGFEKIDDMMSDEDDLQTVSIIFWIFRTYGYNISSDIFKKFKGDNREFIVGDAKGMLSFFEAAHLGTTTDYIMDEALSFTTNNLTLLAVDGATPIHLSRLIENALCLPQRHNPEMIFAREYISFYEQEKDHDKMLLELAKLNFRFLQLNWNQELQILSKWWKEQDLASRLPPYFRDRMIECYLYAFMIYFEPRFSRGRIGLAKIFKLFTILDDTCDRYGSVPEVSALVHCVNRWDPDCANDLPDYIKTVFKLALDIFEECESTGRSEEGLFYSVEGAVEEFKIYVRANLCYTEWAQEDVVPTFDKYVEIGGIEVSMFVSIACSFLGLVQIDREKGYEWVKSRPKFVRAQASKGRLMNDMTGFEDDMSRGFVVNAINYYMKQYGVTKEETYTEFHKMIRDLDKSVNEELLKTRKRISRDILQIAINAGKMVDATYRCGEEFTHPQGRFKEHITSLFVDIIHL